jgi:hypothetical protein
LHVVCVLCVQAEDEAVLLRLGLAVMGALQQGLLELDDFEALITHLKVGAMHTSVSQEHVWRLVNDCERSSIPFEERQVSAIQKRSGCRGVLLFPDLGQQGLLELDDFEAVITHLKVRGKYLCPQVYVLT